MKKKLFIFDMGNVVVNNCMVWANFCKVFGFSNPEKALELYRGLFDAASRGNITTMESLQLIASRAGIAEPKENYWLSFFHPELKEDTVKLIEDLRKSGYRVVCGSNSIDVHTDYLEKENSYACFDKVYVSNKMGHIKPDISFWAFIRDEEKRYSFDDMFFFDDLKENVDAAASLGIHAHIFTTAADASSYIAKELHE